MNTLIESNGSKWAGESPNPIEKLYANLQKYTLNPIYEDMLIDKLSDIDEGLNDNGWLNGKRPEKYQGFTYDFSGNFYRLSANFKVVTCDPVVISTLIDLIKRNTATNDYKEIKEAQRIDKKQKEAARIAKAAKKEADYNKYRGL